MVFWVKLGLVVVVGLASGYGIRQALQPDSQRVTAGLALFEEICVPAARLGYRKSRPDLSGLVPLPLPDNHADPDSLFLLEMGARDCSVSDVLFKLTPWERRRFEAGAATLVTSAFPMLEPEYNHGLYGWAVFRLWAQYEFRDPRRWVATLRRVEDEASDPLDDVSETRLSISVWRHE